MAALEFDLWQFCHRDLRDLWRPNSGMSVRWVISTIDQLLKKQESSLRKYLVGDKAEWHHQEHLLADIRDTISFMAYFAPFAALSQVSERSDRQKILRDIPKAPLRPGDEPEEIKFATKDELMQLFGAGKPRGRRN